MIMETYGTQGGCCKFGRTRCWGGCRLGRGSVVGVFGGWGAFGTLPSGLGGVRLGLVGVETEEVGGEGGEGEFGFGGGESSADEAA